LVPSDLEYGFSNHQTGFFMGRFAVARHGQSINLGFVDCSAQSMPLWKLWSVPWHANFKVSDRQQSEFNFQ
jgi:hypothetical protein